MYAKIEYVSVRTYPSKIEYVRYVSSSFGCNRNKLQIRPQISSVATNIIKFFERKYGGHFERWAPVGRRITPRHSYVAVHERK